ATEGDPSLIADTPVETSAGIVQAAAHGWANANANELTQLEPRDPVTGYTEMKSLLCRIHKAGDVRKAA
ncbi:MAG: hypothetical protein P8175_03065, partial [Deltaproteobacteria bacterium]